MVRFIQSFDLGKGDYTKERVNGWVRVWKRLSEKSRKREPGLYQKIKYQIMRQKPRINADERRLIAIIHRRGREERKAEKQKSLRPLRSLRLIEFHGIPTAQGNKATVVFQTGFTGSTGCVLSFNPVHPVILSKIKKPQMNADERRSVIPGSIVEANSK
ncbi:MAG: hypothetical protein Q8O41_05855 [Candidatus Methanoperedens sp.]|nr:hypothetical protein [Candidatus Methanoperedens sp.]